MLTRFLLFLFLLLSTNVQAQFPPAAGQAESTAIPADSPLFVGWASSCELELAWQDISDPGLGLVSFGEAASALGPAGENGAVSLGDGGQAILTFDPPIRNGSGWDFAVFENGFTFGNDEVFLELAFVEVSSDGQNFFRFPATSLTDTTTQVDGFEGLVASQLNNLAGKYKALFGTPFDLDELNGQTGLDVNRITHIRLIDVVGSLDDDYASYDNAGRKINDPFPTPFPSSGFDIDAIGVMHQASTTSTEFLNNQLLKVFPNPVNRGEHLNLQIPHFAAQATFRLTNELGKTILKDNCYGDTEIATSTLTSGLYFLHVQIDGHSFLTKKIIIQ